MTEMNGRRRLQPSIRALAQVAVIGVYLETLFYVVPRDWVGYKFIHLLFDYKHGPARRSLEGEILRHLVAPPYSVGFFHWFANLQLLAAILLFMLVTWMIAARSGSASRFVLALLIVSSPTTFKNLLFDQGRQDILGVIALESSMLLGFLDSAGPLSIFLSVVTVPLALINENLLLLYLPACLAIHGCRLIGCAPGRTLPRWLKFAPFMVFAGACLVCVMMPAPRISQDAYHAYLQTKSVQRLAPGEPERWLYSNASDNFAFARESWPRFRDRQWARLPTYLLFGAVLVGCCTLVGRSVRAKGVRGPVLYAAGLACLLPGYAVLFLGAGDVARWFANLNLAFLLYSHWYLSWAEADPPVRFWLPAVPIAAFQMAMISGFGVVYPVFDFATAFRWLTRLCSG
jgi:hypothetical protein